MRANSCGFLEAVALTIQTIAMPRFVLEITTAIAFNVDKKAEKSTIRDEITESCRLLLRKRGIDKKSCSIFYFLDYKIKFWSFFSFTIFLKCYNLVSKFFDLG